MHLMKMKLSFSLLKASSQVPLGLQHVDKISFIILTGKKGLILLLQYAAFESDHAYENINSMMNNSINASNLRIFRRNNDCIFTWYTLHLLEFCQFCEILNNKVAFLLKHPVGLYST